MRLITVVKLHNKNIRNSCFFSGLKFPTGLLFVAILVIMVSSTERSFSDLIQSEELENYLNSDFVIIGTVLTVNDINFSPESEAYKITVDKILKNPGPLDEIYVIKEKSFSIANESVEFNVGDRVLLYLLQSGIDQYIVRDSQVIDKNFDPSSILLPPLKLFKEGLMPNEVVCPEDLQMMVKKSNDHPICVKSNSIEKLEGRLFAIKLDLETIIEKQKLILNNPKIKTDLAYVMAFGKLHGTPDHIKPCTNKLGSCAVMITLKEGTNTKDLPPDLKKLGFWEGRASGNLTIEEILELSELSFVKTISSGVTLR